MGQNIQNHPIFGQDPHVNRFSLVPKPRLTVTHAFRRTQGSVESAEDDPKSTNHLVKSTASQHHDRTHVAEIQRQTNRRKQSRKTALQPTEHGQVVDDLYPLKIVIS